MQHHNQSPSHPENRNQYKTVITRIKLKEHIHKQMGIMTDLCNYEALEFLHNERVKPYQHGPKRQENQSPNER